MGCPETPVTKCQPAQRNALEERIYLLHRHGSLKSHFGVCSYPSFLQAEDAVFCTGRPIV